MAWETLYCPNRACRCYGKPFAHSLLVKNGATRGQKQALCRACGRSIALNYGTAYFDLDSAPAVFEMTIRALAEGVSLRSAARIIQIAENGGQRFNDIRFARAVLTFKAPVFAIERQYKIWAVD